MSAIEISGYVQIVLGAIGIALTLLTAPQAMDAASRISAGEGLPKEFSGAAGVVRVATVTISLAIFTFLIGLGLSVTLSTVASALGAARPMLCSALLVGGVISLGVTGTFAIYRNPLAIPAIIGSGLLIILGGLAALEMDLSIFWITLCIGMLIFLITGLGVLMFAGGIGMDDHSG